MDVVTDNEGQRAAPPAEMLRSGDFIIPTINGVPYLNKPPLLYWAVAGVCRLCGGVSPFLARVPTALCGVLLVLVVYGLFRREGGDVPARWAAFALLASPYFIERLRWANLDIPLTLTVFLGILAYRAAALSVSTGRTVVLALVSGIVLGAAVLLKGPVPFLFLWAVWLGHEIAHSTDMTMLIRPGRRVVVSAFAVAVVTYFVHLPFPVAPAILLVGGTALVWRHSGPARRRDAILLVAAAAVAVGTALPWVLAVLARQDWPELKHLLNQQVFERTYTASEINKGTPFYYVLALPVMLAPWGLLFPLQLVRGQWRSRGELYRFCVATGWLSVALFSLIAGKEYEYILPAVPFLMYPIGCHVADVLKGHDEGAVERWGRIWLRTMAFCLPVLATIGCIVACLRVSHPVFRLEAGSLTLVAVVLGCLSWRRAKWRPTSVAVASLLLVFVGVLARDYRANGQRSPRQLGTVAGELRRRGLELEASRISPALAFYAETAIPTTMDRDAVLDKINRREPYYFLAQQSDLAEAFPDTSSTTLRVLAGPYMRKKWVLVGNAQLPDSVAQIVAPPEPRP